MDIKILKPFWDLKMRVMRKKGQTVKLTEKRATEISQKLGDGYIKAVPPAIPVERKKPKKKSR